MRGVSHTRQAEQTLQAEAALAAVKADLATAATAKAELEKQQGGHEAEVAALSARLAKLEQEQRERAERAQADDEAEATRQRELLQIKPIAQALPLAARPVISEQEVERLRLLLASTEEREHALYDQNEKLCGRSLTLQRRVCWLICDRGTLLERQRRQLDELRTRPTHADLAAAVHEAQAAAASSSRQVAALKQQAAVRTDSRFTSFLADAVFSLSPPSWRACMPRRPSKIKRFLRPPAQPRL